MASLVRRLALGKAHGVTFATALLLTAASASTAKGATITLNGTCSFAKAVTSLNTQHTQSGCTSSGTYGSNDTVNVPNGNFNIAAPVTITRSMTIHGGGKTTAYLQTTADFGSQAIHISNPNAVVKMDNLTLEADVANNDIGIMVEGESDTNLNDNNLELSYVVIASFGNTGLENFGGRVLVQNTLIYLNYGFWGGGVQNVNGLTGSNTWWVAKFVAKNSAISYNTATGEGGGIWSNGRLDLESTLLQGNSSTDRGGAIFVTVVSGVPSPSCKIGNIAGSSPSELDNNYADANWAIISSTIACSMSGSIGTGNSTNPNHFQSYCSPLVTGCPQH